MGSICPSLQPRSPPLWVHLLQDPHVTRNKPWIPTCPFLALALPPLPPQGQRLGTQHQSEDSINQEGDCWEGYPCKNVQKVWGAMERGDKYVHGTPFPLAPLPPVLGGRENWGSNRRGHFGLWLSEPLGKRPRAEVLRGAMVPLRRSGTMVSEMSPAHIHHTPLKATGLCPPSDPMVHVILELCSQVHNLRGHDLCPLALA